MGYAIRPERWLFTLLLCGLILSACSVFPFTEEQVDYSLLDPNQSDSRASTGELIYFTGINSEGARIEFDGGPEFGGMMMGSYLTCASCHGPEGHDGYHVMHMTPMDAPDIRYAALINEDEEHPEHEDEHSAYNLEAFRMAVIEGKHPGGEPLSRLMPRWDLSEQDLEDLFEFLKTIP